MFALKNLDPLNTAQTIWVAYSGGMDSHVLLHCLKSLYPAVCAVHVHHGLSQQADAWQAHCQNVCASLDVSCTVLKVHAKAARGESPEAAARTARYAALADFLNPGDVLVTAHHQNDQAETLLLQLLRGAGLKGLASMPPVLPFAEGFLFRPFLDTPQSELIAYAEQHHLQWITDESNAHLHFDRNYLRHALLPKIYQRWPKAAAVLARSANHCAEADALLASYAEEDLQQLLADQTKKAVLPIKKLLQMKPARQRHVLRYWLQQLGFSAPSTAQMQHLQQDVLHAAEDANPKLCFGKIELRRFRDHLYALKSSEDTFIDYTKVTIPLDLNVPPVLPGHEQPLNVRWQLGQGLRALTEEELRVLHIRFRRGGERCHPKGRVGSHPLNKLFQEWQVEPWLRDKVPLIYVGDQLISVMGYCFAEEFSTEPEQLGWDIATNLLE